MEKQTLEERKPYWDLIDKKAEQNNTIDINAYANGVEDGVKWQQEEGQNKFSDEEVLEILYKREEYIDSEDNILEYQSIKEWFGNNKKK